MLEGTFVHSLDVRDDPELFFVVMEADIHHSSGLCDKVALPGFEEKTSRYRLQRLLVDATGEVDNLEQEARARAWYALDCPPVS